MCKELNELILAEKPDEEVISAELTKLISKGCDLNAHFGRGNTALHNAALGNLQKTAGILISNGANLDARNADGMNPVQCIALWNGKAEMVEFLLDNGAHINAKGTKFGQSALHFAIGAANLQVASLLVNRKADVNIQDNDGQTPLHVAVEKGLMGTSRLLINAGADARIKDKSGKTPLDIARNQSNKDMLMVLRTPPLNP